jgi:glycosyltransferase involved in cell wall biosynthesis
LSDIRLQKDSHKIKIAQLRWGVEIGGPERVLRNIAAYSDRDEFDMRFFFISNGGPYENEMRKMGYKVIVIPAKNGYSILMRMLLTRQIMDFQPDIIHDHGIPPFIRPILRITTKAHLLTYEHGEIEVNLNRNKSWLNWLNGYEYFLFCENILVNSFANKIRIDKNNRRNSNKTSVLPLGIDLESFNTKKTTNQKRHSDGLVLGYIGRLQCQDKGIDYLPQIANKLRVSGLVNFKMLVVGEGPDRDVLNKLIRENDLMEHIELFGFREDVFECMNKMDIVIIPSRAEAFGLSAIEAVAAGAQVVAFDVGGLHENLIDCPNAHLIQPGNVEDMVRKIISIGDKRGHLRDLSGLNFVKEHFDVKHMVRKLEDVYRTIYYKYNQC